MASQFEKRPPLWFSIVAIILIVWNALGVLAFYADAMMSPAQVAAMPEPDRLLRASIPVWLHWVYGIATWGGLLGAIILLLRRWYAVPLFALSFIAVVLQFGYLIGATDILALRGVASVIFPLIVILIAAGEWWFAARSRQRGWIR